MGSMRRKQIIRWLNLTWMKKGSWRPLKIFLANAIRNSGICRTTYRWCRLINKCNVSAVRQQLFHSGRAHALWSRGHGFKSHQVLSLFCFFSFFLCIILFLSTGPSRRCNFTNFSIISCLSIPSAMCHRLSSGISSDSSYSWSLIGLKARLVAENKYH